MKIIVGSKNPVKMNATLEAFAKMFPDETFDIEGVSVSSDVSDQPMTDKETFIGAQNRVNNITEDYDYCVGIEGGLEEKNGELESFAWVVIKSKEGKYGKGKTSTFYLPKRIVELIKEGEELGTASDIVFDESNSKQTTGTIGLLTDNHIDRTKYYVEPTIIALIPFKHSDLF